MGEMVNEHISRIFFLSYKMTPQFTYSAKFMVTYWVRVQFTSTSAQPVVWRVIRWVGNDKMVKDK